MPYFVIFSSFVHQTARESIEISRPCGIRRSVRLIREIKNYTYAGTWAKNAGGSAIARFYDNIIVTMEAHDQILKYYII